MNATPRSLIFLLVAAALVLGACGGSGNPNTQTIEIINGKTAAATPGAAATKSNRRSGGAATTTQPGVVTTVAGVNQAPTGHVRGPNPNHCLTAAGMLGAHAAERDVWTAVDAAHHRPLYVEGPYKTIVAAKGSARGLQGIETVVHAGLYVVSANLTSGLEAYAKKVALCLKATTGRGTIRY